MVTEVYNENLKEEVEKINNYVKNNNVDCISVDTEFPGIVYPSTNK